MKKIRLQTAKIKNQLDIVSAFEGLMDFPDWNGDKLEDWLDMHALSCSDSSDLRRFKSQVMQSYTLEIEGSRRFMRKKIVQFELLIAMVQEINSGFMARTGHPLINVVFL